MRTIKKHLTWFIASALLMLSGIVAAATTFRSAIPFGTASSWSSATGSDPNAARGLWYNNNGNAIAHAANGSEYQLDERCFSPKAYGAVGDNVTDDTVAVQNAINAAGSGGRVCFTPGKYRLASVTSVAPLTTSTFTTLEGPGYFLGTGIPAPVQLSFPNVGAGVGIQAGTNINIKNLFLEGPGTGTGVATTTHIQLWSVQLDNWNTGLSLTNSFYARLYSVEFHADSVGISTVGVYNLDIYGGIWRLCPQAINVTDRIAALNLFGGSMEGWSSAAAITTGSNSLVNVNGVYFESSVVGNAGTAIKNTGTLNTINLVGNQVYLTEASKWFDGNGEDTTTLFARGNKFISAVGSTVIPTAYTLGINATGGSVDIADDDWTGALTAGAVFISGGVSAGAFTTVDQNSVLTEAMPTMNIGSSGVTSGQTYKGNSFTWSANAITAGVPSPFNPSTGTYTNITASTESNGWNFNDTANKTWNTGSFAAQREYLFQAPTYKANGASTITNAATVDITAAPTCNSNMTCTNTWALRVEAGQSDFGATVNAPNFDVDTAGNTLGLGNTRAGPIQLGSSGNTNLITIKSNNVTYTMNAVSSGTPTPFNFGTGTYTNITASTESSSFDFNNSASKTWNTGSFATERDIRIRQPTYKANAASTITDAATFDIVGAPICNSNMTCTNQWALRVEAGDSQFGGRINGTSGFGANYRSASSTVTVATSDYFVAVSGSGARTVNLPAANTMKAGQEIIVQDIGNSSGTITVNPNGSDNINGANSAVTIAAAYGRKWFITDGSANWYVDVNLL